MKTYLLFLPTLIGLAIYLNWPEPRLTRAAKMKYAIEHAKESFIDLIFLWNKDATTYYRACDKLGVELLLLPEREDLWGETNGDTIWMYLSLNDPQFAGTFFHEVGHVLMNHHVERLNKESREGEADYFSAQMLDLYGMPNRDPRSYFYSNKSAKHQARYLWENRPSK